MIVAERAPRGTKVILRVDGKPPEKVDPDDGGDQRRVAKRLGVDLAEVAAALAQLLAPTPVSTDLPELVVECWDTDQEAEKFGGAPIDALRAALAEGKEFHRWHGKSLLCCLDVDKRPGFPSLDPVPFLRSVGPLPALWWSSRSGGLHFVFEADAPGAGFGLTAEQKAGIFALVTPALRSVSVLRAELLANTRRPGPGGLQVPSARYGVGDLAGALTGQGGADAVPTEVVEAWLEDRGLEVGGRYPHERCPFDPGPGSRGDPVVVHQDGVHCFRCAGVSGRGSSPWAAIVKAERPTTSTDPIVGAAVARVHWTQADLMLQAHLPQLNGPVRRAAYHALLTLFDPDSADDAMSWGSRPAIVRAQGGWIHWPSGGTAPITVSSTKGLPWARGTPEAIEVAGRAHLERLVGYVPIRPTRCLVDAPTPTPDAVLVPLARDTDAPLDRTDGPRTVEDALTELRLSVHVPDAFCTALKLAVLCGMRAQRNPATPGFLLFDGPSGSGKGFVVRLAAGILGGPPGDLDSEADGAELARSMGAAIRAGCALMHFDEVGKMGSMWSKSGPLLKLSDTVSWRELHVGHLSAPMTAGIVLTGSTLPSGLTTMREFQRRMARVTLPNSLPGSKKWEKQFRAYFGTDGANVLSTPVGRRWAEPIREWAREQIDDAWVDLAVANGAARLEEDEEAVALAGVVARLHRIWLTGPPDAFSTSGERYRGWIKCWEGDAGACLGEWFQADTEAGRAALCGRLSTAYVRDGVTLKARWAGARVFVKFSDAGGGK